MRTFAQKESHPCGIACPDTAAVRILAHPAVKRFAHDFGRIPIHPPAKGAIQRRPAINEPGDQYEQEADRVAEQVMNIASPPDQRLERLPDGVDRGGRPLPEEVRNFMEPRFGFDFSQVRIHSDLNALRLNRSLNAQAFTYRQHIYYGAGTSAGANALTAHELTHVVQQAGARTGGHADVGLPAIQRVLEVRPPGRGEGSAFERRQELIDRLNAQSAAIQYRLEGRELRYDVIDESALTSFDRQMQRFIDRPELVPMRLTTGANLVWKGDHFGPMLLDHFREAYVDLDDLMADDDFSFRSDVVHFLTERFSVRNYAHRIGTNISEPEYERGHQMGKEAEAALLQEMFNDASIQFNYAELLSTGTWLNNFTSRNHGYQVFQVVRGTNREIAGGQMFVRTRDGRRVAMEDFRAERAAAAPAAP
jgi:hypothetical protein